MKPSRLNKKRLSMRNTIIILFLIIVISTVGVVSNIIFSSWLTTAEESVMKLSEDINSNICHKVDHFIDIPIQMEKVNQTLIENGVVNIEDKKERETFFIGVLKNYPESVYSFSIGTENGEYYGARRNKNNEIEIMMNNKDTFGESWYYSVRDDMTSGDLIVKLGKFDPRTRDWYTAAKKAQKLVFSSIYKHFVMNELAISVSTPIYNKDNSMYGVLGTHIIISKIDSFLREVVKESKSYAVIIDKDTGELIANSFGIANYTFNDLGEARRIKIEELNNEVVTATYKNYLESSNYKSNLKYNNDKFNIILKEYHKEGLNWIVISAVPESLYMKNVYTNIRFVALSTLIALLIAIVICFLFTYKFFQPINGLIDITKKFSQGQLHARANIIRNDEIGRLTSSFNHMADTINVLVYDLETKIKLRTKELEDSNAALNEHKEKLQLILDSTVGAIFGCDTEGNCTFCNERCLRLLGHSYQEELIGKNMYALVHQCLIDGTPMTKEECSIFKTLKLGEKIHSEDEVFRKLDGNYIHVIYNSIPLFRNDEIIGAIVTFIVR